MQLNKKAIVRIVALATAATGLFLIVRGWRAYIKLPMMLTDIWEILGPLRTMVGLVVMFVPVAKLVAVFGLFRCKRWSWFLAIAVLTIEFVVGLQAAIRMCFFSVSHPVVLVPPPHPNVATGTVSLGPIYAISLISIISVVALLAKPIKELFSKQKELA